MKIQRFITLLTAFLLFCSASCAGPTTPQDSSAPPLSEMELPTESGTTTNENPYAFQDPGDSNLFIFHDDWVYFHDRFSPALRRMRPDGSENSILHESESPISDLQRCGDWLYFFRSIPSDRIFCRIRTDGTGFEELDHIFCYNCYVVADDRIYYDYQEIYYDQNNEPYSISGIKVIDTDSTEAQVIVSGPDNYVIDHLHPEGWIYYHVNSLGNDEVFYWRIRPDGTGKEAVSPYLFTRGTWFGDWIYYINASGDKQFYKMRTDGSEITLLSEQKIHTFAVTERRIYSSYFVYQAASGTGYLLSMDTDGNDCIVLVEESGASIGDIQLYGDWIYYRTNPYPSGKKNLYRVRKDGTDRQQLM